MKMDRLKALGVLMIAGVLGALLLYTSQGVQIATDDLNSLKQAIEQEQKTIRVLDAEWAYLNAPERLEKLAQEYFGVSSPSAAQMIGQSEALDLPFPAPIENAGAAQIYAVSYEPAAGDEGDQ